MGTAWYCKNCREKLGDTKKEVKKLKIDLEGCPNCGEKRAEKLDFAPGKDPLKRELEIERNVQKKLRERENKIVKARENSKENYKGSKANLIEIHITLLLSLFGGMLGADRAYKGQFGLAFLKFITIGGLGLWVILDIWINALESRKSWHQYYICLDEEEKQGNV